MSECCWQCSVAPIETSPGVQCGSAAVITIINIIIIWTLGVVLNPGTRSGSRGEAVIKTISFNSAAVRSRETGHATQWQDVRLWRVEQLSCRLCPEIAVIVVMNVDPGCGADSRTEDLLAVIQPSSSHPAPGSSPALTRGQPEHISTSVQLNFWEMDP